MFVDKRIWIWREDRDWIRGRALMIFAREEIYVDSASAGQCDDSNITGTKGIVCSYIYVLRWVGVVNVMKLEARLEGNLKMMCRF